MSEIVTLEVRWFKPNRIPKKVYEWFQNDCPGKLLDSPQQREDCYLCLPESHTYSLKLREGNVELKMRHADCGIQIFNALEPDKTKTWQGRIEQWIKRSDRQPTSDIISESRDDKNVWIAVQKTRWQRDYQSVMIELCQLEVIESSSWSFAFEMEKKRSDAKVYFEQAICEVCQSCPDLTFSEKESFAYPTWLSKVLNQ